MDTSVYVPDARDIVHVDEVEHARPVPEFRGIVEVRFREDAAVSFIPVIRGDDEPRVTDLRGEAKYNDLGQDGVKESKSDGMAYV